MIFGTPTIVTNGLVLYLDAGSRMSYPGSGTTWKDLSGTGVTGSLTGSTLPTFSSDNLGSFSFNGSTTRVDVQASSVYKPQFPLSVSVTFKITANITTATPLIKTDNTPTFYHSGVDITPSTTVPMTLSITYGNNTANNPTGRRTYGTAAILTSGSWYTVTAVLSTNLTCTTYVNGQLVDSPYTAGLATTMVYAGSPASIGYRFDSGGSNAVNGNIASAQIYNRALSAQEVAQNYNAIKARYGLT